MSIRSTLETALPDLTEDPGRPIILIADDEPGVLRLLERVMLRMQLDVRIVDNGDEALRMLVDLGERVRLALLDLNMPGLSGAELVEELRRFQPGLRILLMSGDEAALEEPELLEHSISGFIAKPFALDEIRRSVSLNLGAIPDSL